MRENLVRGYIWSTYSLLFTPEVSLLVGKDWGTAKFPLSVGSKVELEFDDATYCVGYIDLDDRTWHPCPRKRNLHSGSRCSSCARQGGFPCFQEHKCDPNNLLCGNSEVFEKVCKRTYNVYLTLIGNLIKVGITQFYRPFTRFYELGADEAAVLLVEHNRLVAGKIENEIYQQFKSLGVRKRVHHTWWEKRSEKFIKGPSKIEIDDFWETFEQIRDWVIIEKYKVPRIEKMHQKDFYYPTLIQPNKLNENSEYVGFSRVLKGEIVFTKGPIIVCADRSRYRIYRLDDYVGHFIIGGEIE